jgi:hypothetical protein
MPGIQTQFVVEIGDLGTNVGEPTKRPQWPRTPLPQKM